MCTGFVGKLCADAWVAANTNAAASNTRMLGIILLEFSMLTRIERQRNPQS
jgi:hypothetical protein